MNNDHQPESDGIDRNSLVVQPPADSQGLNDTQPAAKQPLRYRKIDPRDRDLPQNTSLLGYKPNRKETKPVVISQPVRILTIFFGAITATFFAALLIYLLADYAAAIINKTPSAIGQYLPPRSLMDMERWTTNTIMSIIIIFLLLCCYISLVSYSIKIAKLKEKGRRAWIGSAATTVISLGVAFSLLVYSGNNPWSYDFFFVSVILPAIMCLFGIVWLLIIPVRKCFI